MSSSDVLDEAWNRGRAAYPSIALGKDELGVYLEARGVPSLDHAADLYLACACLVGVPRAVDVFVEKFLRKVGLYLGRLASTPDFVAEVQQLLSIRLLVGDEERAPRLGEYTGRGSLEGWVRIAATRTALNLVRGSARAAPWTEAVERRLVDDRAELALLKHSYRGPFRQAVAEAAAQIERDHRLLLRFHYVDGMTTAQLAAFYGTSRPTVVRRIADAKRALVDRVQQALRVTIGADAGDGEVRDIFALVESQLEVSLARLLAQTAG
jgi:RNA polymerase sigma-70 factor (ECF subfamily)